MSKKVPRIVPFLDVVDTYLRKEPIHDFPKEWKQFNRAARECMTILIKMQPQTPISAMFEGPPGGSQCPDWPTYQAYVNRYLKHRIPPADKSKKRKK
jgi:hypothetical protein